MYASPISQRRHYHRDVPVATTGAAAAAADNGIELLIKEIRKSRNSVVEKHKFVRNRNRTYKKNRRHNSTYRGRKTNINKMWP